MCIPFWNFWNKKAADRERALVKAFQHRIDDLEQEIAKANKNLKQTRKRTETAEAASQRHQNELERLRERDQQDRNGTRNSTIELQTAKTETKKLADRVKHFRNENAGLRDQMREMGKQKVRDQKASTAELEATRAESRKLTARLKKFEEENTSLRNLTKETKIPELRRQQTPPHSKHTFMAELEAAQAKIREMTQMIKDLEDECSNLRAAIKMGMRANDVVLDGEAVQKFFRSKPTNPPNGKTITTTRTQDGDTILKA